MDSSITALWLFMLAGTPKWNRAMINVIGCSVLLLLWHFKKVYKMLQHFERTQIIMYKLRSLDIVLTRVSCQCRRWDDGFILAEVWALPHIVFEGALGLVAMQGSGVVFRVEAVVWRYPLQAAEWRLAAPWLGQSVTALEALDALEGVLATELTCEARRKGNGKR